MKTTRHTLKSGTQFSDDISIHTNVALTDMTLELADITGRIAKSFKSEIGETFDISNIPSGWYVLRLKIPMEHFLLKK